MENELEEYVNSLTIEQLRLLSLRCLEELMLVESVRYDPENEYKIGPYWESCGEPIIDIG